MAPEMTQVDEGGGFKISPEFWEASRLARERWELEKPTARYRVPANALYWLSNQLEDLNEWVTRLAEDLWQRGKDHRAREL